MVQVGDSDLEIFPIVLGGNVFGWTADEDAAHAILDAFVEAGGNLVDSADIYSIWVEGNSGGESESIIGRWLRSRRAHGSLLVATKVGGDPETGRLDDSSIRRALEASLRRLDVDRIDIYYAHHDDLATPLEETATTFARLLEEGTIRSYGLSNYSPERLRRFLAVARASGLPSPVAFQGRYSLLHRDDYEGELEEILRRAGIACLPHSSLAKGFLTGKYRTRADILGRSRAWQLDSYFTDRALAVVDALVSVAEEHDAAPASVALAWLLSRPGVAAPLASVSNVDQIADVVAAPSLTLAAAEIAYLDDVSAA